MVEALRIFDHYHFRVRAEAEKGRKQLVLAKPPRKPGEKPWWSEYYSERAQDPRPSALRLIYIVSSAAISSMPSHRFWIRRFSLNVCWLSS